MIAAAYLPNVPRISKPTDLRMTCQSNNSPTCKGPSNIETPSRKSNKLVKFERQVVGLTFDGFLQFTKDFEIYPHLANKSELKGFWNNSTRFSDVCMNLSPSHSKGDLNFNKEPLLSFYQVSLSQRV